MKEEKEAAVMLEEQVITRSRPILPVFGKQIQEVKQAGQQKWYVSRLNLHNENVEIKM